MTKSTKPNRSRHVVDIDLGVLWTLAAGIHKPRKSPSQVPFLLYGYSVGLATVQNHNTKQDLSSISGDDKESHMELERKKVKAKVR